MAMTAAYYPSRPQLKHNPPLITGLHSSYGFAADAPMIQRIDVGDSSDDEIPQPMKFSALTKALLENDAPEEVSSPKESYGHRAEVKRNDSISRLGEAQQDKYDLDTPSRAPLLKIVRKPSPHLEGDDTGRERSPRVVQVGSASGSARRTVSILRNREISPAHEYVTPGPAQRAVRISRPRAGSNASQQGVGSASVSRPGSSAGRNVDRPDDAYDASVAFNRSTSAASGSDGPTRYAPSTIARTRNITAETAAPPGSMRGVKRVVGTGSFLRGAPVRRGFRRRDSDDHPSPNEEYPTSHDMERQHQEADTDAPEPQPVVKATEPISAHDFAQRSAPANDVRPTTSSRLAHRPPSHKSSAESLSKHHNVSTSQPRADSAQSGIHNLARRPEQVSRERQASLSQPSYKAPPPRIYTDAGDDQENMPPPTFKRNKDHEFKVLGKTDKVSVLGHEKQRSVADTPVRISTNASPRRALGALSQNTPVRPAPPPPPKMTVLDAATKTAGASTTKSKRRRQHILINGKLFTQMNKLGKGGSGDVYCVMAENGKQFALKKVKLEDCDETAVRGYKGEIDLLTKLKNVDRVVHLYDWELDQEKQSLSVLMEKGDNDLNHVLSRFLSVSNPQFDPVATRFYWKEMLHCVSSVHDHDIVHSDLKPANFLMVSGQLKLIDFGIANAIDTDNTVNVHRDSHIGTPNYMSPESITDTNAPVPGGDNHRDQRSARLMKLGKPSDVWSLGCILYQMTYGRPPFAHIANQISRVMAITNPNVHITFPSTGTGGVAVPASLRGTLRRCLQRDPAARPTVRMLLAESDPWLYPEAGGAVAMSEELLGQIIAKVVERCRDKRGVPGDAEVRGYAGSFVGRIREMVEKEGVNEVQG